MEKVLITGGAGMIGSSLSSRLIDLGYKVLVLDDFSSGSLINIDSRSEVINGSIDNRDLLHELFQKNNFKYVFHFAALFANQNSVDHPEKDLQINGMGTLKVLEESYASFLKGKTRRFFFASSSCVYGTVTGVIDEIRPKKMETPYAITKLLGEHYTIYFYEMFKMPYTIFRFFNSYGPGELPGIYRNVIPNFIYKAIKNEPIIITGTGEETRDFTFVGDVIRGIILAINNDKSIGKTYNIATGKETRIIDLAQKIIELTNSQSKILFYSKRNWDKTSRRWGNIDLISSDLGYKPEIEINEGLEITINWLKKHIESDIDLID